MCDLWLGFGSPPLPNWGCAANQVPLQPVCSWVGLACDSCGFATEIYLFEDTLPGTISSSVGKLTSLTYLTIQSNLQLHGTLPPSIGSLLSLSVLHITNNTINGPIPLEFNQLSSLTYLELYNNSLSGTIPDMFYNLKNITQLYLARNVLTGNVPPSICALTIVHQVWMFDNRFACYPTCLLNAPNPGNTLPVADPNALIPGGGGATYGSETGNLTLLPADQNLLDPVGSNTCAGKGLSSSFDLQSY